MVLVVFVANGEVLVANGKVLVANGKVLVANGKGTGRCYLANECMARPIKKEAHVSLFCNGFHVPNDQIGDCVAEGVFRFQIYVCVRVGLFQVCGTWACAPKVCLLFRIHTLCPYFCRMRTDPFARAKAPTRSPMAIKAARSRNMSCMVSIRILHGHQPCKTL